MQFPGIAALGASGLIMSPAISLWMVPPTVRREGVQGQSRQTGFFKSALRDRIMQVRFFLEGVFKILRFEKFC